ncbi:hypothetical protein QYE76_060666 [Lolium multiflorum]|uniref:C2H2-type domain-containing protein n=1 Tax=Lolium multiflorum TaxID=4521 RepID=A0AAD8RZ89_LOLMU|nr:hypothetical protein QYE76_060666 [Lolium multiflorum]
MKRAREEEPVSLALSLTTESASSCTTSADSSGAAQKKRVRRGRVVATSGEGEFVCKTCSRAFTSFQALGGHRTSHLRSRHGLELGVGIAKAIRDMRRSEDKQSHECHNCGMGFETGQALGGHMRRHREEMALTGVGADDQWVWRSVELPDQETLGRVTDRPPVLLELFV